MRRGRRGSISISTLSQISCDRRLWRKDFEKRKTSTYWPDWVRGRNCHHDHPLAVGVPHLVRFAAVRLPSSGSFAARLCAGFLYNDASRAKKSSENWKKLVNVWFFELVQYGKSSWTILGLPRVLNNTLLMLRFFSNLNGRKACMVDGLRFRNNRVWTAPYPPPMVCLRNIK